MLGSQLLLTYLREWWSLVLGATPEVCVYMYPHIYLLCVLLILFGQTSFAGCCLKLSVMLSLAIWLRVPYAKRLGFGRAWDLHSVEGVMAICIPFLSTAILE